MFFEPRTSLTGHSSVTNILQKHDCLTGPPFFFFSFFFGVHRAARFPFNTNRVKTLFTQTSVKRRVYEKRTLPLWRQRFAIKSSITGWLSISVRVSDSCESLCPELCPGRVREHKFSVVSQGMGSQMNKSIPFPLGDLLPPPPSPPPSPL